MAPDDDGNDEHDLQPTQDEQDLVISVPFSNQAIGRAQERLDLETLGDELADLLLDTDVGEYDGCEYGGGRFTRYFCGKDVDRLFATLQPALKRSARLRGATVIKHYGVDEAGEPKQVTLRL